MMEVVFGDSACGSLKMAQRYGKGKYHSGSVGVIVGHGDGSQSTDDEIKKARQKAEEEMRLEWERAMPMGGDPADVYGFSLALSVGDISEDIPGERRRQVLEWLYGIYPDLGEGPAFTGEMMQKGQDVLREVCARIASGESVRIWYSNQPDELCGLYWLMSHIEALGVPSGQVLLVALPDWEVREDETLVARSGWGSVNPGEWHRYTHMQQPAAPAFCSACAAHWKRLQHENAPLRAVLNGRLVSAPESLYDAFIVREITAQEDEFHEAMLIGTVMGKYDLGIGDAWIAHRIEVMIAAGNLAPVTKPAPDSPIYHRKLKKLREMGEFHG